MFGSENDTINAEKLVGECKGITIKSICGFKNLIKPVSTSFYKNDVKRPKFSVTSKQKIIDTFNLEINNWDTSLEDYLKNDLG